MQKIIPCLWFNDNAEEAVKCYISIFKNGSIEKISYYGKEGFEIHKKPSGSVMTILFNLNGQQYVALNGGPEFQFNESISLMVNCDTQEELDYFWKELSAGGEEGPCGWLKDKFGLSWQIVPSIMAELLSDRQKSGKVMKMLLQMKKLDIAKLKAAAD
ncbi:VOC family protein [Legionella sp. PATHC032]|uniref:VOC family protein n=1 Tax=Legionella sp. PATHC032 TaxID=2992039 RepID=UPI001B065BC3|nr:VOC family protein [Legionella sp. PATHC032]MCW8422387.1 VOC family protein [Legionella sp. PATHC032]HAZ7573672.1 VOC family protein [Legionella pneumophila]HBA1635845.1 VOC family protein [Legionella pneumophila]